MRGEVAVTAIGRDPEQGRGLSRRDLDAFVDAWVAGPRGVALDQFLGVPSDAVVRLAPTAEHDRALSTTDH
jgi:hypothetical protein